MEMWFCVAKTKASDQSEDSKNQRRIILPREKVFHGASYTLGFCMPNVIRILRSQLMKHWLKNKFLRSRQS